MVDDLVSHPDQSSQGAMPLPQGLYQLPQVCQPGQPKHQSLQVPGTEQTQVFQGFSNQIPSQGIRAINDVSLPCDPMLHNPSRVVGNQPALVSDCQGGNRLVNNQRSAPLPKAPTFNGKGWKGFIPQ